MSVENPVQKVVVNRSYLRENPEFSEEQLVSALTSNFWLFPDFSSPAISGIGSTRHRGMPVDLLVDGTKDLLVFSKPYNKHETAFREMELVDIVRSRGINTPPIMALVYFQKRRQFRSEALVVSRFIQDVEVLAAKDLTFSRLDPRVARPIDLIDFYVPKIAESGDKGASNGDMHLGNIGYHRPHNDPQVIFFDFEPRFADILDDYLLRIKYSGAIENRSQELRLEEFENNAIGDLASFCAYLKLAGFPMSNSELLESAETVYQASRRPSFGRFMGAKFSRKLGEFYLGLLLWNRFSPLETENFLESR